MRIFCSLPVALSLAETFRMPFASMSNVTSICGTPRGAGGIPVRLNRPSVRLSAAISRSPCRTWIVTSVWLSAAVLKTSVLLVGIVVFRSISRVITPPSVSTPSESGVTSRRTMSSFSPARTAPWIAAPIATTSSGLMLLFGSLPKISFTRACTAGVRVEPPTSTTSSMSFGVSLASSRALMTGPRQRSVRCCVSCSNFDRVSVCCRCLGPVWSAVMNGRLIVVSCTVESSHLAFSHASLSRCRAIGSLRRSMPSFLRNSSAT